jgi:hypothetical protein
MLPFSFRQMWTPNRDRNPDRVLRNADHLYIPQHNYASLKRMPLFNFPRVWNSEDNAKLNPIQHHYLKYVKHNCLLNQNFLFFCLFLKSYLRSGQCYDGNIFLVALPFSIILCSYTLGWLYTDKKENQIFLI